MDNKIILSTNRFIESTGFGKITHSHSEQFTSLPRINVFKSFLGLKEFLVKPGRGLLPHVHENMTAILVPLKGMLAQKSKKNPNTVISEGEVQLLQYRKGDLHIEYNLNKTKNLDCLVYMLSSKNKNNHSTVFKLRNQTNTIQKILESTLINNQEEKVRFYVANFKPNVQQTFSFKKSDKGIILYIVSGEIILNEENHTLKKNDTYALWNKETISFTTSKKTKFFILEISN